MAIGKAELIDDLFRTGAFDTRAKCSVAYDHVFEAVAERLAKNDDVSIKGFGTFRVKHRESRTCRNPQTGDMMTVPARRVVSFKTGSRLKAALSN